MSPIDTLALVAVALAATVLAQPLVTLAIGG